MTDRPTVLFVCVHNAGRSQMAAGWLRHLAGDRVEVRSAGSEPRDAINPVAVAAAMVELGLTSAEFDEIRVLVEQRLSEVESRFE